MASSSLLLSSSATTTQDRAHLCSSTASSFLSNPNVQFTVKPRRHALRRCGFRSSVIQNSFDHIPKQFREENLIDGLMDNYKNIPQSMYGLTPSQLNMFTSYDDPIQKEHVTEETISSSYSYKKNHGCTLSSLTAQVNSKYGMSSPRMYHGRRPRRGPPDLPSLLLDNRIVYLGLPMVPAVAELIMAEFLWLDYDDNTKPIYLYIRSSGTLNENNEIVGSESDAFAIVNVMLASKAPVYTINAGLAYGQAAALLALGEKGKRGTLPNSPIRLHLPQVHSSSGSTSDMYIKGKELNVNMNMYLDLLVWGIEKPKKEIYNDIRLGKFFSAQEAIEYGIVDQVVTSEMLSPGRNKPPIEELRAKARAREDGGEQASPSGSK